MSRQYPAAGLRNIHYGWMGKTGKVIKLTGTTGREPQLSGHGQSSTGQEPGLQWSKYPANCELRISRRPRWEEWRRHEQSGFTQLLDDQVVEVPYLSYPGWLMLNEKQEVQVDLRCKPIILDGGQYSINIIPGEHVPEIVEPPALQVDINVLELTSFSVFHLGWLASMLEGRRDVIIVGPNYRDPTRMLIFSAQTVSRVLDREPEYRDYIYHAAETVRHILGAAGDATNRAVSRLQERMTLGQANQREADEYRRLLTERMLEAREIAGYYSGTFPAEDNPQRLRPGEILGILGRNDGTDRVMIYPRGDAHTRRLVYVTLPLSENTVASAIIQYGLEVLVRAGQPVRLIPIQHRRGEPRDAAFTIRGLLYERVYIESSQRWFDVRDPAIDHRIVGDFGPIHDWPRITQEEARRLIEGDTEEDHPDDGRSDGGTGSPSTGT